MKPETHYGRGHPRTIQNPRYPFRIDPPTLEAKPIWQLKDCHCHWPLFDQFTIDSLYCGRPVANEATPFCRHHYRRAYTRHRR
jgi:hypothetical protein